MAKSSPEKRAVAFLLAIAFVAVSSSLAANTRTQGTIAPEAPWQTDYFIQDSGQAGPTVLITGGIHGNEPAGAIAADQIRHWPIRRGKIIVVPRANSKSLHAESRYTPDVDKKERNLNRDFPRAGEDESPRGDLAAALWQFAQRRKPDWVLDLHEGFDVHQRNPKSVGGSLIVHPNEETDSAATLMLEAINRTIDDEKDRFVRLGPPVNGSLARAAAEHLGASAMIVETAKKDQPISRRVRQHRLLVHRLLESLDMIDRRVSPERITDRDAPAAARVALYDAEGIGGKGVPRILSIVGKPHGIAADGSQAVLKWTDLQNGAEHSKEIQVHRVGPADIRHGILKQFDVVIFSGGTGGGQAKALGEDGRRQVKRFVDGGAGYIGICAGAYLACDGFSWGLKVLDAKTASPKWRRGRGTVKMELTQRGRELLAKQELPSEVLYANGPILAPAGSDLIPDYQPLAYFRSEVAKNGTPPGIMRDSPAIVAGRCGQGRVICFSPHPEQSDGLEPLVISAIRWAAGGD